MVEAFVLLLDSPIAAWLGGWILLEASIAGIIGKERVAGLLCTDSKRESDHLLDRPNALLPWTEAIDPEVNAELSPLRFILSRCLG